MVRTSASLIFALPFPADGSQAMSTPQACGATSSSGRSMLTTSSDTFGSVNAFVLRRVTMRTREHSGTADEQAHDSPADIPRHTQHHRRIPPSTNSLDRARAPTATGVHAPHDTPKVSQSTQHHGRQERGDEANVDAAPTLGTAASAGTQLPFRIASQPPPRVSRCRRRSAAPTLARWSWPPTSVLRTASRYDDVVGQHDGDVSRVVGKVQQPEQGAARQNHPIVSPERRATMLCI